jgi:hypothetical protein
VRWGSLGLVRNCLPKFRIGSEETDQSMSLFLVGDVATNVASDAHLAQDQAAVADASASKLASGCRRADSHSKNDRLPVTFSYLILR